MLETVEVQTGTDPVASIVWLHGLGADGHDFEPIVPQLGLPSGAPVRFVFPHAPVRPVTLNFGMAMRAWFDILGLDRRSAVDEEGIRAAQGDIEALLQREHDRGIPYRRMVLAGFSQGGALALHTALRFEHRLAGMMGLSCYLPLIAKAETEAGPANADTPVFMAHGAMDPVVDQSLGEEVRDFLHDRGHEVLWHSYPVQHAVCPEEIGEISRWLLRVLELAE